MSCLSVHIPNKTASLTAEFPRVHETQNLIQQMVNIHNWFHRTLKSDKIHMNFILPAAGHCYI